MGRPITLEEVPMRQVRALSSLVGCALLVIVTGVAAQTPTPAAKSKAWKMQNAMSAAPSAISKDATILDWPEREGDQPVLLRRGTNGWTCFPDDPSTPGNDPMCLDKTWLQWVEAWMAKKDFTPTLPGIGYMLQGGSTASNTDPFATKPAPGEKWMKEQPHVMVIV